MYQIKSSITPKICNPIYVVKFLKVILRNKKTRQLLLLAFKKCCNDHDILSSLRHNITIHSDTLFRIQGYIFETISRIFSFVIHLSVLFIFMLNPISPFN